MMTRKIYCKKCLAHYNVFIRQEAICSQRFLSKLAQYIFLVFLLLILTGAMLVLDGYLKVQHAKKYPEKNELTR